jgi:hypothetical protein
MPRKLQKVLKKLQKVPEGSIKLKKLLKVPQSSKNDKV